ncbi:MAG TPA: hypothetical protein VJX28_01500 [Chthoniobacterales bacterium]|nr:hypothetical protein [Chthoniobacterales bacterium]
MKTLINLRREQLISFGIRYFKTVLKRIRSIGLGGLQSETSLLLRRGALGSCALMVLVAATGHAGLVPRTANDRDFISAGKGHGYYMVSSNSGRWWHWGLGRAPVVEPTWFTAGYGDDVIVIPFDANDRVAYAPVYIYTILPDSLQKQRLEAVTLGVTAQADVRRIFGRPDIQGAAGGYKVWFYQIRVYNPFEEFPDLH